MDLALVKHRLLQGSLVGLARTALAVPIYLVLTPFLLRALGPNFFGIWSFGAIIMSVLALTACIRNATSSQSLPSPTFAQVHRELRCKGVTLQFAVGGV